MSFIKYIADEYDEPEMLDEAINQFDNVWIGSFCKNCDRRAYCADPIK